MNNNFEFLYILAYLSLSFSLNSTFLPRLIVFGIINFSSRSSSTSCLMSAVNVSKCSFKRLHCRSKIYSLRHKRIIER